MSDFPIRIKKLKGPGIVRAAAKHNLREIAAEIGAAGHIDPARIQSNLILRGPASADEVASEAKARMADAGITRPRATAVMALELLFTLPADTGVNVRAYFDDATRWAESFYQVPLLSSVVHLDEAAPHCHVLLLPLVEGHMVGSDLYGNQAKLKAMQASFHEQVRARYGMARHAPAKRHNAAVRAEAMKRAWKCLDANSGLSDDVLAALLKPHAKDPEPLLLALGLSMPATTAPRQSFVAIMTRPTKPDQRNPIGKGSTKPIGKAQEDAPETTLPYPCVGKGFAEPAISDHEKHESGTTEPTSASTATPLAIAPATGTTGSAAAKVPPLPDELGQQSDADEPAEPYTRERDTDHRADQWDADRGEWIAPKAVKASQRAIAGEAARMALRSIGRASRTPQRRVMRC